MACTHERHERKGHAMASKGWGITAALRQPWLWLLVCYCQVPTVLQGSGVDGWCLTVQGRQAFRHDTNHQIWSTSFWLDLAQLSFVCCFVLVQALVVVVELVVHSSHQVTEIQGESMPRFNRTQKHTRGFRKKPTGVACFSFLKSFQSVGVREKG